MTNQPPIVFLVDDEPSVLKSLCRLLRSAKLNSATFTSPQDFLDQYDPSVPGCLVVDVAMPDLDGLQLQQALTAKGHQVPVIFLTGHGDIPMSVRAMKRGAVDFLTKPVDDEDLLKAIRVALASDQINRQAEAERNEIRRRLATLTPREHEVMTHVIAGRLNKQIGDDLGTVEKTVKVHRGRFMEKMGVQSVAALVRMCEIAGVRPATPSGPV